MTTQLQAENDVYKRRRSVEHQDGNDEEFWETAYFIPGISGKARCLSNNGNGDVIIASRKDQCSGTENSNGYVHSWCTPSALRSNEEGVQKESASSSASATKECSVASSSSSSSKKVKENENVADEKVKEQTIEVEKAPVGNPVDEETKDKSKKDAGLTDALQQDDKSKSIQQFKKAHRMPTIVKEDGREKNKDERTLVGQDAALLSPVEEELEALLKSMRESR